MSNNNALNETINSKTLLQINASLITGVFIFASISSLQIFENAKDQTSNEFILLLQNEIDRLENFPSLTEEFNSRLNNSYNSTDNSIETLQNYLKKFDNITQEKITYFKERIENEKTLDIAVKMSSPLSDTSYR